MKQIFYYANSKLYSCKTDNPEVEIKNLKFAFKKKGFKVVQISDALFAENNNILY